MLDRESQLRFDAAFARRTAVSDPFTEFMTGQLSERHAAEDRRVLRFVYVGLAGFLALAFANLFI